ncbi:cysteine methyltransferase [Lachnoclostridium sp. An298]|nr:cysteine methyltransferase [Lachnoclostridium sp. An298]
MSFDFYKRATIVCRAIPYGKAATYGQIALLCGRPKNARQVGYALNRNRLGDAIPAHRVVNARGILSGAAAFETADMQKILLENEGVKVRFTPDGWQVDLKKDGWQNTMEDALRFLEIFQAQDI